MPDRFDWKACLLSEEDDRADAQAFKAGIIHRDISAGNMLLYKDDDDEWCGVINDWELSKKVDFGSPEGRQPDRTVSIVVRGQHDFSLPSVY